MVRIGFSRAGISASSFLLMTQLLLPERHPIRDFFVLDALDVAPRSDMASMEHPIFSLSTKPETRPLKYTHGDNSLDIIPSALGLPTVFDKDVLIYCISKLVAMQDDGRDIGPCIRLTTHDLLVQTNRPTNDLGYERLAPALDRLKGVTIKTNIKTGDCVTTRGFGLINEFEYNRKGSMFVDRLRFLEIELSPWLFRAIEACDVLPISRSYFRLRRPLDRRIYELARKHCGQQNQWRVSLEVLQKKSGSNSPTKKFAFYIRHLIASNHLPDYTMTLEGDQAVFWRRAEAANNRVRLATSEAASDTAPGTNAASEMKSAPTSTSERRIWVSSQAIERLYEIAPGWDKYMLEHAYIDWAKDKDAARNEDAEITGLRQDKFWRGSQYCVSPSGGEAQNFCKGYYARRAELAAAVEADRLTKRVSDLTAEIQILKSRGAGEDKDPQARMLAVLSGLAPDMAQKVLIVAFAFLVELGAAFGLFLATGHSFGERSQTGVKRSARDVRVMPVEDGAAPKLLMQRGAPAPLRLRRLGDGALVVDEAVNKG